MLRRWINVFSAPHRRIEVLAFNVLPQLALLGVRYRPTDGGGNIGVPPMHVLHTRRTSRCATIPLTALAICWLAMPISMRRVTALAATLSPRGEAGAVVHMHFDDARQVILDGIHDSDDVDGLGDKAVPTSPPPSLAVSEPGRLGTRSDAHRPYAAQWMVHADR